MASTGECEIGAGRRSRWVMGSRICPCELEEVVGGTDHRPFLPDLWKPAEEALPEAPCRLDLTEHRLDDLLAQAVSAAPPGASELGGHGGEARARLDRPLAGGVAAAVARAARREPGGDAALGEESGIGLVAIAGVGGEFVRVGLEVAPNGLDQRHERAAIGRVRLHVLRNNDLMRAIDRDLCVVPLDHAVAGLLDAAVGIGEVALRPGRRAAPRAPLRLAVVHHPGGWSRP